MTLRNDIDRLTEEHKEGELTATILLASPPAISLDHIQAEILRLDKMIDAEPNGERHTDLCAAFRALNWARSPNAFSSPSGCVLL
jgi:hypothetical protein